MTSDLVKDYPGKTLYLALARVSQDRGWKKICARNYQRVLNKGG